MRATGDVAHASRGRGADVAGDCGRTTGIREVAGMKQMIRILRLISECIQLDHPIARCMIDRKEK